MEKNISGGVTKLEQGSELRSKSWLASESSVIFRNFDDGMKLIRTRVAVYYYRSQKYNLGDAKCWVDDNLDGAVRLPGWWDKGYNVAV